MQSDRRSRPTLPAAAPRAPDRPTALDGLRVVDFTHFIAGPFATMMLADFGADVVKIEAADEGDGFRRYPPALEDEGVAYLWVNRNKRGVALDLKEPAGREVALRLTDTADVVIENFSTGVMQRLGLDYEAVRRRNPSVIYCSVSSYGRSGSQADRVGFDPIVQAESGFMSMNGFADSEPVRAGPSIMDTATAMMACNAVLAAVVARQRTGVGQYVEVTMIDSAINMLGNFALAYLATGLSPSRFGNTQTTASPVGCFRTADGPIYLACANDRTFRKLAVDVLHRPEWVDDPRFRDSASRREHRDDLMSMIDASFRGRRRDELLAELHASGVPAGAVRTVAEALDAPEVAERGLLAEIPHRTLGSVPNMGLPIRLHGTPLADPRGAPPLGADTDQILRERLGCDDAEIRRLEASGALGASRRARAGEGT